MMKDKWYYLNINGLSKYPCALTVFVEKTSQVSVTVVLACLRGVIWTYEKSVSTPLLRRWGEQDGCGEMSVSTLPLRQRRGVVHDAMILALGITCGETAKQVGAICLSTEPVGEDEDMWVYLWCLVSRATHSSDAILNLTLSTSGCLNRRFPEYLRPEIMIWRNNHSLSGSIESQIMHACCQQDREYIVTSLS